MAIEQWEWEFFSVPNLIHLHKSRYCDIVPVHNPFTKVATISLPWIWLVSETSYGTIISYAKHVLCLNVKWKLYNYPLNSDWKDRSDWLADNNNFTSRASSNPTFVKGWCRGTITLYWCTYCKTGHPLL